MCLTRPINVSSDEHLTRLYLRLGGSGSAGGVRREAGASTDDDCESLELEAPSGSDCRYRVRSAALTPRRAVPGISVHYTQLHHFDKLQWTLHLGASRLLHLPTCDEGAIVGGATAAGLGFGSER